MIKNALEENTKLLQVLISNGSALNPVQKDGDKKKGIDDSDLSKIISLYHQKIDELEDLMAVASKSGDAEMYKKLNSLKKSYESVAESSIKTKKQKEASNDSGAGKKDASKK
jgi:hypothetical protein